MMCKVVLLLGNRINECMALTYPSVKEIPISRFSALLIPKITINFSYFCPTLG